MKSKKNKEATVIDDFNNKEFKKEIEYKEEKWYTPYILVDSNALNIAKYLEKFGIISTQTYQDFGDTQKGLIREVTSVDNTRPARLIVIDTGYIGFKRRDRKSKLINLIHTLDEIADDKGKKAQIVVVSRDKALRKTLLYSAEADRETDKKILKLRNDILWIDYTTITEVAYKLSKLKGIQVEADFYNRDGEDIQKPQLKYIPADRHSEEKVDYFEFENEMFKEHENNVESFVVRV